MYGFHGFSKSLFGVNYSCSDLTVPCARTEWTARSLGCRRWVQESPKPYREGTETLRIAITAAPVLRTSSCKDNAVISHQIKLFAFTGQERLTRLQNTSLQGCLQPRYKAQGCLGRIGHSPTSRPLRSLFSIYWCFLQSSSFTSTALFFRVFFLFLSNWWRLPLCGKSLHGRWFCKIPLAVACETCKSIRALLGQFSWAPNKTVKST